jgi:hypothetical protein
MKSKLIPIVVLLFAVITTLLIPPSTTDNSRIRISSTEQQPKPALIVDYPLAIPLKQVVYASVKVLTPIPVAAPAPAPVATYQGSAGYSGTGDADLDWIVAHESGGNPYAMNSIGACGLFQSLPCSKVLSACSSLDDVACQIRWGQSYCLSRYGSTANARSWWEVHSWY